MPSVAVFVCYMCEHVFTLPPSHFCQKECDKPTALHRDVCPKCRRTIRIEQEAQFVSSDVDDGA